MCLALPSKVIKVKGKFAWMESDEHHHRVNPPKFYKVKLRRVNLSLVKNVKVGDFLLTHEHLALNKIPKSEAKKILKMVGSVSPPKFFKKKLGRVSEPHK